jgi:hypothetical protein
VAQVIEASDWQVQGPEFKPRNHKKKKKKKKRKEK